MKFYCVAFGILLALMQPVGAADFAAYSGAELYNRFCASCHGAAGRGDGPVAPALKIEVPDLRLLSRRHGNTFPDELVERVIDGRHVIGAHGTRMMPIWGEDFARERIGDEHANSVALQQIRKLVEFIKQLQLVQSPKTAN